MKIYVMPGSKKQDLSETISAKIHDYHIEAPDAWSALADKIPKQQFPSAWASPDSTPGARPRAKS